VTTPTAPRALPDTLLATARDGLDACVHCGFCLQSCPTYLALEDENDSPRGRLVLMRALLDGALPPDDPDARTHLDRCLGCRACETACPSGVPYGSVLETARATLAGRRRRPLVARFVLAVFARPTLLGFAMAGARLLRATRLSAVLARVPGRVGFAFAMLDATRPAFRSLSYDTPDDGVRGTAALLDGCVMRGLFAPTNRATARVLAANGYRVIGAPGQRCCGALHAHAGDLDGARELARSNIAAFERAGADVIAVNSAGCGAMLEEYGHLLADDPAWADRAARLAARVRDVSELLAGAGPAPARGPTARVVYDAPCHLVHAQRVSEPPLHVLAAVGGLEMVPLAGAEQCCGGAGIYSLLQPAVSQAVLAPKVAGIRDSRAAFVATGNPGCLMQIGAGLSRAGVACRAVHPVDLLDAAYGDERTSRTL
jgi:glycolate dehydrogenase iron-sulfur subunit